MKHVVELLQPHDVIPWEQLEGQPPPDALLAYHLLCLVEDGVQDDDRERLKRVALAEADAIASTRGIPRLTDIEDVKIRRDFIRNCS